MAQIRYWNWEDDDSTFRMNQRDLALLPEGRYRGFDLGVATAGWVLSIDNEQTGGIKIEEPLSVTPKLGTWKTRQGMIVEEDSPLSFTISPIPTLGAGGRYDIIVGEHNYEQVTGGTVAVYKIIEGIASVNPSIPSVTIPKTQVVLGILWIPYTATSLTSTGVKWTPSKVPTFASDPTVVHTDTAQSITGKKTLHFFKMFGVQATIDIPNKRIVLPTSSNFYWIDEVDASLVYLIDNIKVEGGDRGFFGWEFQIHTSQRLELAITANVGGIRLPSNSSNDTDVQKNDVLTFMDYGSHPNNPFGAVDVFLLTNGGQVNTFGLNKMNGILSQSSKLGITYVNADTVIPMEANYVSLNVVDTNSEVTYIQDPFADHSAGGIGNILITEIKTNELTVIHGTTGTPPAGSAVCLTPTGNDFVIEAGSTAMWLRTLDGWLLTNVINSTSSILNLVTTFDALTDTLINSIADRDIALYDNATSKWKNTPLKKAVEETVLLRKRVQTGYTREVIGTSLVSTGGDTITATYKGLELSTLGGLPSQANFVNLLFNTPTVDKLAVLPSAYPVNTIVGITFTGTQVFNLIIGTAVLGTTWLPITTGNDYFDNERELPIKAGKTIFLKRGETSWELISNHTSIEKLPTSLLPSASINVLVPMGVVNSIYSLTAYRDQLGFVSFKHTKLKCNLATGSYTGIIGQLPIGFRPIGYLGEIDTYRTFVCPVFSSNGAGRSIVIGINTNGVIAVHTGNPSPDPLDGLQLNDVVDLKGIRFETDVI